MARKWKFYEWPKTTPNSFQLKLKKNETADDHDVKRILEGVMEL
jgi:hypothetical protein